MSNSAPGWDDHKPLPSTPSAAGVVVGGGDVPDAIETYTDEEIKGIEELRSRLEDLRDSTNHWTRQYYTENSTLWRYVLAKSRDINPMETSENMFRSSVIWREEINMDKMMSEWRPSLNNSTGSGGESQSQKLSSSTGSIKRGSARARLGDLCIYTGIMEKPSATGGPVMVERLGKMDLVGLYNNTCK